MFNQTVYLFFNHPARLPADGDKWNNWTDPDTTKLAWVAGESWRRSGWRVKRLDCSKETNGFKPFTGQLRESVKFYPQEYFNVWFTARRICAEFGPTIFTTIDVINYWLTPEVLRSEIQALITKELPHPCNISFQSQHFSASCVLLDHAACNKIISAIWEYDQGFHRKIECDLVSDETIIRNYVWHLIIPLQRYSVEPQAQSSALVHVPKSVIPRLFDSDAANAINQ